MNIHVIIADALIMNIHDVSLVEALNILELVDIIP